MSLSFIGDYLGKESAEMLSYKKIILSSSIAGFLIIRIVLRIITGFVVTAAAFIVGNFCRQKEKCSSGSYCNGCSCIDYSIYFNGLAIF